MNNTVIQEVVQEVVDNKTPHEVAEILVKTLIRLEKTEVEARKMYFCAKESQKYNWVSEERPEGYLENIGVTRGLYMEDLQEMVRNFQNEQL